MEVINTWSEGLNKDIAKTFHSNKSYLDALNVRLSTEEGQSAGAIINIKGNESFVGLPTTSAVFTITAGAGFGNTGIANYIITINGTSYNLTGPKTFTYLLEQFNTNSNFTTLGIRAWLSDDEDTMTVTSLGTVVINSLLVSGVNLIITNTIPVQTNLIPIGYTLIRDDIFIFSTNETAEIPASTGGIGQIWKLVYDAETLNPTLTLLYNNYLNFTTYHPIAPSAAEGRYENSNIQRIYWTDNFNSPRSFNTADENGFILDLSLLDFQIPVDFNVPTLQKLSSGSTSTVKVGIYQAAFRLKNSSTVTIISELSDMVSVVNYDEGLASGGSKAGAMAYTGSATGANANKIIKWKISGLDTDFDRIECFVLIREALDQLPRILLTHDEPIPGNGEFEFTYTGATPIDELTLNQFLAFNSTFTHAKTLASKHNYLLVGNTRNQLTDFDFDARAYRSAISSNDFIINDSQGVSYSFIGDYSSDYDNIPLTHDAINPNQDTYKYKKNSTTIGGTGRYISYEFGTTCLKADSYTAIAAIQVAPFAYTNSNFTVGDINLGVTDQDYPTNSINDGIKYAYRAGLLKGYQRNEIYRFAIHFFDNKGNPLFARWIGDIKFPDYGDTNPNPGTTDSGSTVPADFRLSFEDSVNTNQYWVNQLYIKFSVTIPASIKPYIGGYRIVRVERNLTDKTILGSGLLTCVLNDGGGTIFPPDHHASSTVNPTDDLNLSANSSNLNFMFDSPEFLLNGFPGYVSGDQIRVNLATEYANSGNVDTRPNAAAEDYRIIKQYKNAVLYSASSSSNQYGITEAGFVDVGGTYIFTNTPTANLTFRNYTRTSASESASVGSTTMMVGLNSALAHATTYGCTENSYRKLYVSYYRPVTSQYGGNTYSARTRNTYIPCGSFQPILVDTSIASPFVHKVFGGDIFVDIYDNQKLIKNWGQTPRAQWTGAAPSKESFTYFFPCESTHNFNLRHGIHINNALYSTEGSTDASTRETYDYNTVYSNENNIKTSLPKPLDFTSIEEHDTRFWISELKINGEDKDSWTLFRTNNWIDAESAYGPVNSMLMFKNEMMFFQDGAFGVLPVNQRSLIQDNTLTTLQLGTGSILDKPSYVSTKTGSKHQWSTLATDTALYFFDVGDKSLLRFSSQTEPLTLIKGLSSYFKNNLTGKILTTDNPIHFKTNVGRAGVTCVYDYKNNEVLYTFHDCLSAEVLNPQTAFTIAYSELFETFSSFYSFKPHIYISDKTNFFTPNPVSTSVLYIHNTGDYCKFYENTYESTMKIMINPVPDKTKIATNFEWLYETYNTDDTNLLNETWNELRVYNDYQNTDYITLTPGTNLKRKQRNWQTVVPRNAITQVGSNPNIFDSANINNTRLFRERLRDKYFTVDFVNNNTNNYRFVFPMLKTIYQISPR